MGNRTCRRADDDTRVREAIAEAEELCLQRGIRLTALRRRVLEIIWSNRIPLGAYAILDVLRQDGRRGAPPTVYRALEFLMEHGLIHRLASLNVYIGCCQPARHHGAQFLICENCGKVSEMDSEKVQQSILREAAAQGFEVQSQVVEVLGRCPHCRDEESDHGE